jgi:hypothetical protein
MATRSTIALEYADGTVDQIYCHWDGYLEGVGKILLENYMDPFKVQELMDLGDVSSLGEVIGEKHPFGPFELPGMSTDEYQAQYGNMTTFYGRDRGEEGEDGTTSRRFVSFDDYVENHQYEEFEYILRPDGVWYVWDTDVTYTIVPLSVALKQQSMETA